MNDFLVVLVAWVGLSPVFAFGTAAFMRAGKGGSR